MLLLDAILTTGQYPVQLKTSSSLKPSRFGIVLCLPVAPATGSWRCAIESTMQPKGGAFRMSRRC